MRVAGIMSGTSLDGIDVAIVDIAAGKRISTPAFHSTPYSNKVRQALLSVSNADTHTGSIAQLNFFLGELYSEALMSTCRKNKIALDSIELIGCHGQTIFHQGRPAKFLGRPVASTLQIGEASVIAERTGIPVISDFRTRDMAAGGKGAPLVPFVDYLLFRHKLRGRIALNIGGIANITVLPPGAAPDDVTAFDTGPGNMVIDELVIELTMGKQRYDSGGKMAAKGSVDLALLEALLADSYYSQKPPKTAGREQYGSEFLQHLRSAQNPIATATELTVRTIVIGIERFAGFQPNDLIVSGGGAHNHTIMNRLRELLPDTNVITSAEFGIAVDAKEAIAFAVLAHESWHHRPSNVPSATGARYAVVLGKLTV